MFSEPRIPAFRHGECQVGEFFSGKSYTAQEREAIRQYIRSVNKEFVGDETILQELAVDTIYPDGVPTSLEEAKAQAAAKAEVKSEP